MPRPHPASALTRFADLPDPRRRCRCSHDLLDRVVIAIRAVLCGCDDWVEVAHYGRAKRAWLNTFLKPPHGTPSHDTFGRGFARLDPAAFRRGFLAGIEAVAAATGGRLVAIDGETVRRSFDTAAGRGPLHLISAWAAENRLVPAQVAVDGHSNEITALPEPLALLDLTGAVATLDAMGCQKTVVEAVRDRRADYVIAVKGDQPGLSEDIGSCFRDALDRDFGGIPHRYQRTVARGHGRVETRHYYIADVPDALRARHGWRDLRSGGRVFAERRVGAAEPPGEARFFISSLPPEVTRFARAVRGHWSVENGLPWTLDVQFREDESRVHKGHGPENRALLRRLALPLLQRDSTTKASVKAKRKLAGWDNDYLLMLLLGFSKP